MNDVWWSWILKPSFIIPCIFYLKYSHLIYSVNIFIFLVYLQYAMPKRQERKKWVFICFWVEWAFTAWLVLSFWVPRAFLSKQVKKCDVKGTKGLQELFFPFCYKCSLTQLCIFKTPVRNILSGYNRLFFFLTWFYRWKIRTNGRK